MHYRGWALVIFLAVLSQQLTAQKILILEKVKTSKRIKFYVDDEIAFRVDGDKYNIKGNVELILDSAIVVDGEVYQLKSISAIMDYEKYAVLRVLSKSALIAIPPMLLITALHRGLNTHESPLIDKNALQVTGVFAFIGLALAPFKAKKYDLEGQWSLRIIDTTPG